MHIGTQNEIHKKSTDSLCISYRDNVFFYGFLGCPGHERPSLNLNSVFSTML